MSQSAEPPHCQGTSVLGFLSSSAARLQKGRAYWVMKHEPTFDVVLEVTPVVPPGAEAGVSTRSSGSVFPSGKN